MNQRKIFSAAMLLIIGILLAGCRADIPLRKQRYFASARRFSAEGKYKEATLQYLNVLKVDQDSSVAHFELALVYEHMGQFSAACDELDRAVDADPSDYKARVEFGSILLATGRINEAQAQADTVLEAQPNNASAHALLSSIASRRGDTEKALKEIRRSIELDPGHATYHDDLALIEAGNSDKPAEVESELMKAVKLDASSLNAKLLLEAFYARYNRWAEAEKVGWEALETTPSSLTARANVAETILREGDGARAEQVLRQAVKDFPYRPEAQRNLADFYTATGQLGKAVSEFSAIAAQYPKDASVQSGYARVLIQAGNYAGAKTVLAGMVKNNPDNRDVIALNAILNFLNGGAANDAETKLRDAAAAVPQDAFIQYWLGKTAAAAGDLALAESSYRQALYHSPAWSAPQEEMWLIASQRGDLNLLNEVAERAIAASPHSPDGYVWRASIDMEHGRAARAEADLKTAINLAPQNWQAYLEYGKLRLEQKRYSESTSFLEQALALNPDSIDALRFLVDCNLRQNQPSRAVDRISSQIKRDPNNSSLYDLLTKVQIQAGNMDQAAASARKAVQLDSADGDAVMLFTEITARMGLTENAVSAWKQWSTQHPRDAGALAILGTLEESRGNRSAAENYYKAALQIDPQQPVAANNLACEMLAAGEELDKALALAQIARKRMPNLPNTADTLAWAYYRKGSYDFARNLLEDAIRNSPNNATMQYHLGMVLAKLSDKSSALDHLKKAVSLAPESSAGKDAKVALRQLG